MRALTLIDSHEMSQGKTEAVCSIARTVKIHSPMFVPPALEMLRKLRMETQRQLCKGSCKAICWPHGLETPSVLP